MSVKLRCLETCQTLGYRSWVAYRLYITHQWHHTAFGANLLLLDLLLQQFRGLLLQLQFFLGCFCWLSPLLCWQLRGRSMGLGRGCGPGSGRGQGLGRSREWRWWRWCFDCWWVRGHIRGTLLIMRRNYYAWDTCIADFKKYFYYYRCQACALITCRSKGLL